MDELSHGRNGNKSRIRKLRETDDDSQETETGIYEHLVPMFCSQETGEHWNDSGNGD
jgi:hypothetical protein